MSETTIDTTEAASETSADTSSEGATATESTQSTTETSQGLGDAGKKALDAMKADRNKARDEARALREEFEAFKAKADGKEAEFTAAQEAQRVKDEALAAANSRILRSEVKAAAKGVLADPQDAYKFLDLDSFEVNENGEVDDSAIADALTELIEAKPYLAAQGKRFQGGADGGARTDAAKVSQLNRSDLDRMSPEDIAQAHEEGRFDNLLGPK